MQKLLTTILLLSSFHCIGQENLKGQWKTIDDETGEAKSIVEIYDRNGKYYGKIVKLFRKPTEEQDPICTKCPKGDPRYKQKIIGMEIIKNMIPEDGELVNGEVLKPDEGKIYDCKIWLEDDKLMVRGYWGFLYRTQEWQKVEN